MKKLFLALLALFVMLPLFGPPAVAIGVVRWVLRSWWHGGKNVADAIDEGIEWLADASPLEKYVAEIERLKRGL